LCHPFFLEVGRQGSRKELRKMTGQSHGGIVIGSRDDLHARSAILNHPSDQRILAIYEPGVSAKEIGASGRQAALVRAGKRMSGNEIELAGGFAKRLHDAADAGGQSPES